MVPYGPFLGPLVRFRVLLANWDFDVLECVEISIDPSGTVVLGSFRSLSLGPAVDLGAIVDSMLDS